MSARELLAQFDVGVNTSQIVRADSLLTAVAQKAAAMSSTFAGVAGKAATIDVDASGLSGVAGLVDMAKNALGGLFALGGAHMLAEGLGALVEEGAHLQDLSDKLGVGTDELQRFAYATSLAGVESDKAYASLGKAQRILGSALGGDKAGLEAFKDLGVAFKDADGTARPLLDIVGDVADSVKDSGTEAEAAAKLTKLFGKSGADLIPAFKDGGQAIRDLAEEFDALGGGLSSQFVKDSDEADDQMTRLKFASKSLKATIAAEVLPYVNRLAKGAIELVKGFRKLTKDTHIFKVGLVALGSGGAVYAIAQMLALARSLGFVSAAGSGAGNAIKGMFSFGVVGSAVVVGVLLLAALFEDLYTLMTGGQSVLGDFLDKTYGFGASKAFVDEFKNAWSELNSTMADGSLDGVKTTLSDIGKSILPTVLERFVAVVRMASAFAKAAASAVESVKAIGAIMGTLETNPTKLLMGALSTGGDPKQTLFKGDNASNLTRDAAQSRLGAARDKFGAAFDIAKASIPGLAPSAENGGTFAQRGFAPQAAAASVIGQGATVTMQNAIKIEVKGGVTNADTGAVVATAVNKGIAGDALTAATAAVSRR